MKINVDIPVIYDIINIIMKTNRKTYDRTGIKTVRNWVRRESARAGFLPDPGFCTLCLKENPFPPSQRHHPEPYLLNDIDVFIWLCISCHGKQRRGSHREKADFEEWIYTEEAQRLELFTEYGLLRAAIADINRNPDKLDRWELIGVSQKLVKVYWKLRRKRRKDNTYEKMWQEYKITHIL